MKRSEIFENYVKIAEEKAKQDKETANSLKKLEETGRRGMSPEEIAELYNVKTKQSPGQEYKDNMFETAHKEPVVLFNAYDKLNGLIENNIERQNILLRIVNKPSNGNQTNHKYAADLAKNLVRLSNSLSKQNPKLATLSDVCLNGLHKKALAPAFVIAPIAIALGALYAQQHMAATNVGYEKNSTALKAELEDLLTSSSSFGVGYNLKASFKAQMADLKAKVIEFDAEYAKIYPIIESIQKPRNAKELIELAKTSGKEIEAAYTELNSLIANYLPYFDKIAKNFSSTDFKESVIEDKGWMTNLVDKAEFLHGGKGLIADDFDDVVKYLKPYTESLLSTFKILKEAGSLEQKAKAELAEAASKTKALDTPEKKDRAKEADGFIGELGKMAPDFLKPASKVDKLTIDSEIKSLSNKIKL